MPLHCKRYINHFFQTKEWRKIRWKKSKIKAIKAKIPLLKASWHDLLLLYWAATGKSSGKNGRHRSVIFGWCWRSDGQIDVSGDRRRTTSSSTCRPNTSQTPGKMRAERACESRLAAQSTAMLLLQLQLFPDQLIRGPQETDTLHAFTEKAKEKIVID